MVSLILHPTEELKLVKLQKELIKDLFEEGKILYAQFPLWIYLPDFFDAKNIDKLKDFSKKIKSAELYKIDFTDNLIFCSIKFQTEEKEFQTNLSLIKVLNDSFSENQLEKINENLHKIKMPVKQLKVFRLGIEKETGKKSKSISDFVWCKIK